MKLFPSGFLLKKLAIQRKCVCASGERYQRKKVQTDRLTAAQSKCYNM